MQLNDIIILSIMVSNAHTITDIHPMLLKMADTDISIWYLCVSLILYVLLFNFNCCMKAYLSAYTCFAQLNLLVGNLDNHA